MTDWISSASEVVWRGALAATVPVLLIALLARFVPARPATRHTLWLIALAWFVAAPLLPAAPAGWRFWDRLVAARTDTDLNAAPADPTAEKKFAAYSSERPDADDASSAPRVPTPPRTGARRETGLPPSLAQAACESGRRSQSLRQGIVQGRNSAAKELSAALLGLRAANQDENGTAADDRPTCLSAAESQDEIEESASLAWLGSLVSDFSSAAGEATRSLFGQLSPFAAWAWLGGAMFLILARPLASWLFQQNLVIGAECPRAVQDLVAQAATHVGLERPPRIVMVEDAISPMVSFVGGPRLLLPARLWSQLDDAGRRAILYHELAHLRRGDHWVRWAECIVSAVYWWHPLMWWIRRGLAEEAENCCDAWVTWLLPAGRRAYARALLKTTEFIHSGGLPTPALGIGVSTVRARRIARRLTMVMTKTTRPGMSMSGLALVVALAVVGWLTTPAWSKPARAPTPPTPPVAAAPTVGMVQPATPAPMVVAVPGQPTPPVEVISGVPLTPPVAPDGVAGLLHAGTSWVYDLVDEEGPRAGAIRRRSDDEDDGDIKARLERLERRLEEMAAMRARTPAPFKIDVGGEKIAREYRLPAGKLEALMALMSRQDVPITVQGGGDHITVHATAQQHEVFEAFVRMINPGDGSRSLPRTSVLAPGSLPRIAPGQAYGVAPAARLGRTFSRSPRAAEPKELSESIRRDVEHLMKEREKVESKAAELRGRADEFRAKAGEMADQRARDELKHQAQELAEQAREMARQAREMKQQLRDQRRNAADAEKLKTKARVDASGGRRDEDGDDDDDEDVDDDNVAALAAEAALADAIKIHEPNGKESNNGGEIYNKAFALHNAGKYAEAVELFKKAANAGFSEGASLYNAACGYARLGEKDRAFEYLEKSWSAGYQDVGHMREDDDLNNLRGDKRLDKILDRGGKDKDGDKDDDDDDDDGDK